MAALQSTTILDSLKRSAAILRDVDIEFALGGGLSAWVRGGPPTEHDVDLLIREADSDAALAAVTTMRDSGVEAYMYVGFGANAFAVLGASQKFAANGYDAARITMSIFMGTIEGLAPYAGLIDNFEGWVGVDQFDERNVTFTSMLDRFEKRFGRRPVHCYTAQGFDMGNVVAHGLATAKPHSRDGLRRSLEQIRRLDATVGGPGNHISFGHYDHRGYKGDYITMRKVVGGKNVLATD